MIAGPLAEIDLRALADREIQHHRRLRRGRRLALEKAVQRVHAAAVAMLAHQGPVHGRDLDALGVPGEQLLPKRLDAGDILRWRRGVPSPAAKLASSGIGPAGSSQPRCAAQLPQRSDLYPAHPLRTSDRPVGLAQPQPLNNLTVLYISNLLLPIAPPPSKKPGG